MEVLLELTQPVLVHLQATDTNKLLRTSKSVRAAIQPYEEWYWSGARMVKVLRNGHVKDGKRSFMWVKDRAVVFESETPVGARETLEWLWRLRESRSADRWSLFVDCKVWSEILPIPIPCYLFHTDAVMRARGGLESGWPVWIACEDHPYRRCDHCHYTQRFRVGSKLRPEIWLEAGSITLP